MRFCVLGSGSKGNCTYVESGTTRLLIDAGFSGREIERRLSSINVDIAGLSAILVTHEHSDHSRGVGILSRKYRLPVLANADTVGVAGTALAKPHVFREFETGGTFVFQDLEIHPFSVSHDAADPVGFVIGNGRFSMGYCTDTGTATRLMGHRLAGCNALILESNHDPEMLRTGPYPLALQQRVRSKSGHLANVQAVDFLGSLMHARLYHVVLAHISLINNTPALALETMLTGLRNTDAAADRLPNISVAWQDKAAPLIDLSIIP